MLQSQLNRSSRVQCHLEKALRKQNKAVSTSSLDLTGGSADSVCKHYSRFNNLNDVRHFALAAGCVQQCMWPRKTFFCTGNHFSL